MLWDNCPAFSFQELQGCRQTFSEMLVPRPESTISMAGAIEKVYTLEKMKISGW